LGAKVSDTDMKPNAVPFLFLPGVALIGSIAGGWDGLAWGVIAWMTVVGLGTIVHLVRHASERFGPGAHRVDVAPPAPTPSKG
jgi:hypothetical protein